MKSKLRFSSVSKYTVLPLVLILCLQQGAIAQSASSSSDASMQKYQQQCQASGGYFQYGTINSPPNSDYPNVTNFRKGKIQNGVPLTHTHIEITSAIDNKIYDVAIDNVFAPDYDPKQEIVPPSYAKAMAANATIYLCSGNPSKVPYSVNNQKYATQGFDWVHTNCASSGYKTIYQNGFTYVNGANLTNSQTYCKLWPNKK